LVKVIGGIVSYGIGHIHSKVASWRLLFIILGLFTICWGVMLSVYMPDSPMQAKFLNDREKYIAIDRVKDNMTGIENKVSFDEMKPGCPY
jgi:MFS family permease